MYFFLEKAQDIMFDMLLADVDIGFNCDPFADNNKGYSKSSHI